MKELLLAMLRLHEPPEAEHKSSQGSCDVFFRTKASQPMIPRKRND